MTVPNYPLENNPYNENLGGELPCYGPLSDDLIRDRKNNLELAALLTGIFAIVGLFTITPIGLGLIIASIILAIIALAQRKKYALENRRIWMPIIGLACGIFTLIITVVGSIVILKAVNSGCLDKPTKEEASQCIADKLGQ